MRRATLLGVALVFGLGAAGCGGGGSQSSATQAATTASTTTKANSSFAKTMHDDVDAFTQALGTVTATCPVPKVTLQTMNECKTSMLALIRVDDTVMKDLDNLDVPAQAETAVTQLRDSLTALDNAQKAIIRKFIDKGDVSGFKNAGGLGSPIDNAINATKDAFAELQLLAASGG